MQVYEMVREYLTENGIKQCVEWYNINRVDKHPKI